jgi:hypothetical protein
LQKAHYADRRDSALYAVKIRLSRPRKKFAAATQIELSTLIFWADIERFEIKTELN